MNAEHLGQDPLVIGLVETTTIDASEVGAKAANLGRLAREGFPVPPGLVVTPAAEGRWGEARTRLLEAAAALGAESFAVRSSGTAEDLEGASFAGQYETILGVPLGGLPEAVRRVFDSAGVPNSRDRNIIPNSRMNTPPAPTMAACSVQNAAGVMAS